MFISSIELKPQSYGYWDYYDHLMYLSGHLKCLLKTIDFFYLNSLGCVHFTYLSSMDLKKFLSSGHSKELSEVLFLLHCFAFWMFKLFSFNTFKSAFLFQFKYGVQINWFNFRYMLGKFYFNNFNQVLFVNDSERIRYGLIWL